MPIPGDKMKDIFSRGTNLIGRFFKDVTKGRTAVAGKYKLSADEKKILTSPKDGADLYKDLDDIFQKNPTLADQNSLEAFMMAQGKKIKAGDELSVSGLGAVLSRYYSHTSFNGTFKKSALLKGNRDGLQGTVEQGLDVARDLRDVGAVAAAGVIGFKAVQTGVSLLVGDDF